jgi:hypothetical protein
MINGFAARASEVRSEFKPAAKPRDSKYDYFMNVFREGSRLQTNESSRQAENIQSREKVERQHQMRQVSSISPSEFSAFMRI